MQSQEESTEMTNDEFTKISQLAVMDYFNGRSDCTDKNGKITEKDVFVVWMCKTLQNHKALLSTTVPDGMYYELTYNGDKGELYLDAYKKWENVLIHPEIRYPHLLKSIDNPAAQPVINQFLQEA